MESHTPTPPEARDDNGLGLRLRIWIGCLAGALVCAAGLWLAVAWFSRSPEHEDSALVWVWLPVIATGGILVGLATALWLDHGIVTPLRGFLRSMSSGALTDLRGLPSASGWGEVSALGQQLQGYLTNHREAVRAAKQLEWVEHRLEQSRAMIETWIETERWTALPTGADRLGRVADLLNDGLHRAEQVREQNRDAAVEVRRDLDLALEEARASAEQTERGFVEATALLTTVRELQRLSGDLDEMAMTPGVVAESPAEAGPGLREAATEAIHELVTASTESVEHLSKSMLRVREVSEQVQVLGNRATLLALNVVVTASRPDGSPRSEELAAELKALAQDVRLATERTEELTRGVEQEVVQASDRMRGIRERVAQAMDRVSASPRMPGGVAAIQVPPDHARLLERVREMIQDATRKGERLSSAGERASRAAERLVRRLEEQVAELEGLAVRLEPIQVPGASAESAGLAEPTPEDEPPDEGSPERRHSDAAEPRDARLRLLGPDDVAPGARRTSDQEPRS